MLSVAFDWPQSSDRAAATQAVEEWRITRQALLAALPPPPPQQQHAGDSSATPLHAHRSWGWAGTDVGEAALRAAFAEGSSRAALLSQFL